MYQETVHIATIIPEIASTNILLHFIEEMK